MKILIYWVERVHNINRKKFSVVSDKTFEFVIKPIQGCGFCQKLLSSSAPVLGPMLISVGYRWTKVRYAKVSLGDNFPHRFRLRVSFIHLVTEKKLKILIVFICFWMILPASYYE